MNSKLDVYFSKVFCRMRHKTQLFNGEADDHFHTRLQHTLEVEEVSLQIANKLNYLNPSLETRNEKLSLMALMHDIGHTPFGHAGERALHEIVSGKDSTNYGLPDFKKLGVSIGFKHNLNSGLLYIENCKYEDVDYVLLEGIVKHSKLSYKTNDGLDYGFEYIFHDSEYKYSENFESVESLIIHWADEIAQVCSDFIDILKNIKAKRKKESFISSFEKSIGYKFDNGIIDISKLCQFLINKFCNEFLKLDDYKNFKENEFTKTIAKFDSFRAGIKTTK